MRALVVYESMYGNTRAIAEAITSALQQSGVPARVTSVGEPTWSVDGLDLLVLGAPTHTWSMSRARTRAAAARAAERPGSRLQLEPDALRPGLREWLERQRRLSPVVAVFDTRSDAPALLTGRAARSLAHRVTRAGGRLVIAPQSFLVKDNRLVDGELDRARRWGQDLAERIGRPAENPAQREEGNHDAST
jgi:menaquinone-dependent protoporphyrinogen IX oxidase